MKTKLQIVQDTRRRLEKRGREVETMQRRIVKETIAAIFEVLGMRVVVGEGYLNHHAQGVTVAQSNNGFEVEKSWGRDHRKGPNLKVFILDETDDRLLKFKSLLAADEAAEKEAAQ